MAKQKLTPWFPASVRPVHAGIYETRGSSRRDRATHPQFQHWDGIVWSAWASEIWWAEHNEGRVSVRQEPEWRGLAEEPK